jgi:hypothetical protein
MTRPPERANLERRNKKLLAPGAPGVAARREAIVLATHKHNE